MAVAIIARGAASSLGLGPAAFAVGAAGESAPAAWSRRSPDKVFGRVTACPAERTDRPRALFERSLAQVVEQLSQQEPSWRTLRLGVVVGTSSGGLAALERALAQGAAGEGSDAWRKCSYFAPLDGLRAALGRQPDRLVSLYGACASSALALGLGMRWLELGVCQLVIAGGYDAESDLVCAGFDSLKATSKDLPRPFRADRDGMALGEGAALLALMQLGPGPQESAARAYGFIQGFGASSDAVHITAPDRTGSGLARAAESALQDAALRSEDVDLVSAHGTGTSFNDASEAAALRLVFGERALSLPLHAFKPSVGHTLGAASALESLAALTALEQGLLPASASHGAPMPDLPSRLLESSQPAPDARYCLKLATAFGGSNAALVLSRFSAEPRSLAARPVRLVAAGEPITELELGPAEAELVCSQERLPRSDALSLLAVVAAGHALADARRRGVDVDRLRTGVIVGSVAATLEADAAFAERILSRGPEHAEPRRFPATSPNACAGHVAIAFGLGGVSHAVGAGADAAFEALEVARDWLAAGDAEAVLVIAAEAAGPTSERALRSRGIQPAGQGACALLLSTSGSGPLVDAELLGRARAAAPNPDFRALQALRRAAGLPDPSGFGSVRPPE